MIERQKRLIEVYEHLRRYFGIHTKTGFAEALHYGRTSMSAAMNGDEKYLTDSLFKNICEAFPGVFDLDYLLTGEGQLLTIEEDVKSEEIEKPQQPDIPDYLQRLLDEAVRMSTRNEMLERQCEKLIAELRDSKDNNEKFISELRKSKEYNDTLVAELKISRCQNDNLISELRETKKQNAMLATKLEAAIDGIEGMKNQLAMMAGAYATPQPPTFAPLCVNDDPDSSTPEGLIRGEHQVFTEEIAKSANNALDIKAMRV
jgi:hypothetical protein